MALGRSLNALLSESDSARKRKKSSLAEVTPMPSFSEGKNLDYADAREGLRKIPLDKLNPSKYQPRQYFDEDSLKELADSIKEHGLLEPLLVRQSTEGNFEIVCGERRFRAAKIAGLTEIPCLLTDVLEKDAYAIALVENLQRQDLNPIEEAMAYSLVLKECGITQDDLAKTVGKSRSTVANVLRLNSLDEAVKEYVISGQLDMGHARALLALEDKELQSKTARYIVQKGLNVRQTELFVKQVKEQGDDKPKKKAERPLEFDDFEKKLSTGLLGTRVKFTIQGENKGKLTLSYANKDQLDSIIALLGLNASNLPDES